MKPDHLRAWAAAGLLAGTLVAAMLTVPPFVKDLHRALHEPQGRGFDQRTFDAWLIEQEGGHWTRYGWWLNAGERARLRIRLPGSEPGVLALRLWVFPAGTVTVFVVDPTTRHPIPPHALDGRILDLRVAGSSELIVDASNTGRQEQLVLHRSAAAWFPPSDRLPRSWPLLVPLVLGVAGWGALVLMRPSRASVTGWVSAVVVVLAAAAGWGRRWALFDIARGLPADPDVVMFMRYARSLRWFTSDHGFYSGNFLEREPVHVAALHLWSHLWGDTIAATKFYTLVLSVLLIVAAGAFVWKLAADWRLGGLASWIVALSPAWIEESVRGLRLESLTLVFVALLGTWRWGRGATGAVLLGLLGGLMALIQSPALGVVIPLVWTGWALNRWGRRRGWPALSPAQWSGWQLGLASLLAVAIYAPHLHGLHRVHGDASWPSYGYARWNANMEFPERLGTPGFPTAEEFARTPYAGPRISYGEYLFGLHSVRTLLWGQLKGWLESTVYMSVSATPHLRAALFLYYASGLWAVLSWWVGPATVIVFGVSLGLTVVGWIDAARRAEYWWIPFLSLWGTWYVAYLYSVRLVEPFRHTGHVYLLLLFCSLWGAARIGQGLGSKLRGPRWRREGGSQCRSGRASA